MATRTKVKPTAAATHAPKPDILGDVYQKDANAEKLYAKAEEMRQPAREEVRPQTDMPVVEGRAVAYSRSGQLIQRTAAGAGVDRFALPSGLPPPGWSWEWKSEIVLGEKQDRHLGEMAQVGWEPVMYESYPGQFAPRNDDTGQIRKGAVRREGMILMERAAILTQEAQEDARKVADERVGTSKRQYSAGLAEEAGKSQTAAYDHTAQKASYVRTATETLPPLANRQKVD